MKKDWVFVGLSCVFELFWVYGLNVASIWWQWLLVVFVFGWDLFFLARACENLPTGTVYAFFAAAGTVGTTIMDILLFGAEFTTSKGLFILLLLVGVVSLKLADNQEREVQ